MTFKFVIYSCSSFNRPVEENPEIAFLKSAWIKYDPRYRDGTVKTEVQAHYVRYQEALNLPRRSRPITLNQLRQVHSEWGKRPFQKKYCIECTPQDHEEDISVMVSRKATCINHHTRDSKERVRYLRLHTPE